MNTATVGLAYGDCAKAKIVDILASDYDVCTRFAGGNNSGHTCVVNGDTFKLHLVPCGALRNLVCVLANGMVIDPLVLRDEINFVHEKGFSPEILVSHVAHVIMPWHRTSDVSGTEGSKIGTTRRGVGPAYATKMHRWNAIRMGDLLANLREEKTQRFFAADAALHGDELWNKYHEAAKFIQPYICDTGKYLRQALKDKKNLLFEGAQGIGLDIDHGFSFPFVTSSATGPAAIPQSCGLPNLHLNRIIGVLKCHFTRVGNGPFPSEIWSDSCDGELLWLNKHKHGKDMTMAQVRDYIRSRGNEYGTTTGRPRRIGWFHMDLAREAVALTGATEIALMHADTTAGLPEVGMMVDGKVKRFPGWDSHLSPEFNDYVRFIEENLGIPVKIISYGPDREQVYYRT
ncbi:MAG TPA: adenylosuccinate synthetase [bacterium]|nr:adenylosuccinate synthetase [bacterium]